MHRLLIALPAALFAAALASPALAQLTIAPAVISVEGEGEVYAAPDTAFVTSGVTTDGKTAREALDANTAAMTRLVATLREAGIEPRDIQTSGFTVTPQYVYSSQTDASGYTPPPTIVAYQVSNLVNVRVRKIGDLGTILDRMVTVGANTINGVSFSVDDTSALLEGARKAAFANARAKAQLYADAADVQLGRIVNIVETTALPPQPYQMRSMAAMDAAASPVPVEAGEVSYAIRVSVQWELDQDAH